MPTRFHVPVYFELTPGSFEARTVYAATVYYCPTSAWPYFDPAIGSGVHGPCGLKPKIGLTRTSSTAGEPACAPALRLTLKIKEHCRHADREVRLLDARRRRASDVPADSPPKFI